MLAKSNIVILLLVYKFGSILSQAQHMRPAIEASLQGIKTFGDLDGRWLRSDTKHSVDPYSRVLYFHARRAVAKGLQEGYVVREPDISDFASDHSNKDLLMRFLDDSLAFQDEQL